MNKNLLFVMLLVTIGSGAFAQTNSTPPVKVVSKAKPVSQATTKPALSIAGEFGIPTGAASHVYGSVVGGSLKLELPVAKTPLSVVFTGGISSFLVSNDYRGVLSNASYLTFEGGGKYYFSRIGYVEADLGISNNINSNYVNVNNDSNAARGALIYAPALGFTAPTSKHKAKIDISLRYEARVESGGSIEQVALRVAYKFGI